MRRCPERTLPINRHFSEDKLWPLSYQDAGLVFWPVGNGDSTTIVLDSRTCLQVDLNHLEKSEDDDDANWAVVDELVERLPRSTDDPILRPSR